MKNKQKNKQNNWLRVCVVQWRRDKREHMREGSNKNLPTALKMMIREKYGKRKMVEPTREGRLAMPDYISNTGEAGGCCAPAHCARVVIDFFEYTLYGIQARLEYLPRRFACRISSHCLIRPANKDNSMGSVGENWMCVCVLWTSGDVYKKRSA